MTTGAQGALKNTKAKGMFWREIQIFEKLSYKAHRCELAMSMLGRNMFQMI